MTFPLSFGPASQKAEMPFSRVAIVGLGLIGGSVALAVRRAWPQALIIAVDRKAIVERGTVLHAIDVGADDLGMVSEADLVLLAAPVSANARILHEELSTLIASEAVVTDVGGVKRMMVEAAAGLPDRVRFIGGHPIAGSASGGLDHAQAELFDGRPWVLCPAEDRNTYRLDEFVAGLGATPVTMDAVIHDRLFAFLSHLPQLTVSALMTVIGTAVGEEGLKLAGSGLRDSTRLAASPTNIWREVGAANADNIGAALDALIQLLENLKSDLNRGEVLEQVFSGAQHWKSKLRS